MTALSDGDNLAQYPSADSTLSRKEILSLIDTEMAQKYSHLYPHFIPDYCLQAKIRVANQGVSLIKHTPPALLRILESQRFVPDSFEHYRSDSPGLADSQQYVLDNKEIERIGFRFVMKATIGPSFISFWFRNTSDAQRFDVPVLYALEIINTLSMQIAEAEFRGQLVVAENTGDSNKATA